MDKTKYWENRVNRLIRARIKELDRIFAQATQEAARIGASINLKSDKPFSFDDFPQTKKIIDDLMGDVRSEMEKTVVYAIDGAWKIANDKEDEFCNTVFAGRELTKAQKLRYFDHADKAREAFAARKTAGLNLSDRVWRYTEQFKQEIEMGLDIGISEGKSAADMARNLKQYLQQPDKLFRRVRDKRGNLQLSKNAAAYHPGAGVYRSSYKNALRLTRTETNMAYRTADHMRYQNLDFVVGIEIHTSNNHPVADICDELKGKYPKDFKFVGWHPQCRCYVTSVLKTEEEMIADTNRRLAGENVSGESVNEVRDVPQGFKDWMKDNQERIEQAEKRGTLPYFITDNKTIVGNLKQTTPNNNDILKNAASITTIDINKSKCLVSQQQKDLKNLGFDVYYDGPIDYDFDVLSIVSEFKNALGNRFQKYLGNVFVHENSLAFEFTCDTTLGEILCQRIVHKTGIVEHALLDFPTELQGQGLSKALFRAQYESYKKAGITKMKVCANINVGGYCWASYGFCSTDCDKILDRLVKNKSKLTAKEWAEAGDIVDRFYSKHPKTEPFPMKLLSSRKYGHRLLDNTMWEGELDLNNTAQRADFEAYLFG